MHIHKLKKDESRTEDGKPVYLTPAGIKRLEEELTRMKLRIPVLAAEAARTAAYGDRSDNAEYKQAKGALRGTQRRLLELQGQLKRAIAIPAGIGEDGTIRLGSTVTLEVAGKNKIYEIVGPVETDPDHGRISYESPLGKILIGHGAGETMELKVADGRKQEYRILEVR